MFARSRRKILVVSVAMGLVAAGLAGYYLTKASEAASFRETVVVAKTAIPARATVTEDMLDLTEVPQGARHPEASGTMAPFIGKVAKQSIAAREQVLTSKFFNERSESGLAFVIPPDRRAIAVGVDERIGVGGMIAAGDRLDVMGVCTVQDANNVDLSKAVFALQNIEVLAVAQKIVGEEAVSPMNALSSKGDSGPLSGPREASQEMKAKTITMALTPKEAQAVVLMEENPACNLRMALRSPGNSDLVPLSEAVFNPRLPLAGQVQ